MLENLGKFIFRIFSVYQNMRQEEERKNDV